MEPDDLLCSRNVRPYPQKEVEVKVGLRLSNDQSDQAYS